MKVLCNFTFSKSHGNYKPKDKVKMEKSTAEVMKAKGFGDFEVTPAVNMTFDKENKGNEEPSVLVKKIAEIQKDSDQKVKDLKEKFSEDIKTKDQKIKELEDKLAKMKGGN